MALKELLYLFMVTVIVLSGNHKCIAETVRSLGKPLLQTLFLTAVPVNDSDTTYTGVFLAPSDTQFEYDGKIEDVTQGKNDVVAAILSNSYDNYKRWLTVKSESKRETVQLYTNYNSKLRTQESFVENSCDVGIEKIQNDTRTEYKTTVRNCAESGTISKYFIAVIRDKSGKEFKLSSRDISTQTPFVEYYKYLDTYYTKDENSIYYAILNYPAMKADGISLQFLWFVLLVSEGYDFYEGEAIALEHAWYYDLEIQ